MITTITNTLLIMPSSVSNPASFVEIHLLKLFLSLLEWLISSAHQLLTQMIVEIVMVVLLVDDDILLCPCQSHFLLFQLILQLYPLGLLLLLPLLLLSHFYLHNLPSFYPIYLSSLS